MSESNKTRLNSIIKLLIEYKTLRSRISINDVIFLIQSSKELFLKEPTLLELSPPINIVGDIHGQFSDILRLFKLNDPIPKSRYLFLGDYVDRGPQGLEVMCLLLALKLRYPNSVYMLRGNHECKEMTELYGFAAECISKQCNFIYNEFCSLFDCMPLACTIARRIFCVHGGISPQLESVQQIRDIRRPVKITDGLISDLLWSDPDRTTKEWGVSERGVTYVWGLSPVKRFLLRSKFSVMVRAHQMAMQGIEFPFAPERSVITVFSAPGYASQYQNKGAILKVDSNLVITTSVLYMDRKSHQSYSASNSPRKSYSSPSYPSNTFKYKKYVTKDTSYNVSPIRGKATMLQ